MKKNFLFPYLWEHKFGYIFGILILFAVDYLNLFIPKYIGDIVDGISKHYFDLQDVFNLLLVILGIGFLVAFGRFLWRIFIFGTGRKIEKEVRNDLFQKLELLSPNYFTKHKTGDLMANFTNDVEALLNAIGPAIVSAFDAVVMTTLVLYQMMTHISFRLTVMVLVPMSVIAVGSYFFGEEFERRFENKQRSFAKLSDKVQESVSGERVIKAFTQEKLDVESFLKVNKANYTANMRLVKLMAAFHPSLSFIIASAYAISIIYGGYLTVVNSITLGSFIAFQQYLGMLIWPMIAFGDAITMISQGRAATVRIAAIFKEEPEIKDEATLSDIKALKGEIKIEHLSFSYGAGFKNALEDINLEIKQGETFAILGRTGDGKSTLVNLLLRLYNPSAGQIYFDGVEIRQIPLNVLRNNIAYVPQESYLFSDTISGNIRFGKHDASQAELEEVAKIAAVHDNILDFIDGYETVVGERGVTLSGGQKQRISIARAILKDAPILILDDALSAVDTDTEGQILASLKEQRQGKTTIMIAHRISTLKNADHIMVLDDGHVKEYGNFTELMALNGIFKDMYLKQQLEAELQAE